MSQLIGDIVQKHALVYWRYSYTKAFSCLLGILLYESMPSARIAVVLGGRGLTSLVQFLTHPAIGLSGLQGGGRLFQPPP